MPPYLNESLRFLLENHIGQDPGFVNSDADEEFLQAGVVVYCVEDFLGFAF